MTSVPIRAALLVLALCAGAWFVHGFRTLDLEAEGLAATTRAQHDRLPPSELPEAVEAFRDASRFSADQGPLVGEGYLLSASGRRKAAYAVAMRVVADEPDNAQAWFLARLTAPDRRRADAAGERLEQLNALVDAVR